VGPEDYGCIYVEWLVEANRCLREADGGSHAARERLFELVHLLRALSSMVTRNMDHQEKVQSYRYESCYGFWISCPLFWGERGGGASRLAQCLASCRAQGAAAAQMGDPHASAFLAWIRSILRPSKVTFGGHVRSRSRVWTFLLGRALNLAALAAKRMGGDGERLEGVPNAATWRPLRPLSAAEPIDSLAAPPAGCASCADTGPSLSALQRPDWDAVLRVVRLPEVFKKQLVEERCSANRSCFPVGVATLVRSRWQRKGAASWLRFPHGSAAPHATSHAALHRFYQLKQTHEAVHFAIWPACPERCQPSKPIGFCWSCLACRTGCLVPTCQPYAGSLFPVTISAHAHPRRSLKLDMVLEGVRQERQALAAELLADETKGFGHSESFKLETLQRLSSGVLEELRVKAVRRSPRGNMCLFCVPRPLPYTQPGGRLEGAVRQGPGSNAMMRICPSSLV
jgi:hypothetical protein